MERRGARPRRNTTPSGGRKTDRKLGMGLSGNQGESKMETRMKMTWDRWQQLTPAEKHEHRDLSDLSSQLSGLEGWRVEVETTYGEVRRFIVGRSTGWRPIHLEVKTRRSVGGDAAEKKYRSVRKLYYTRERRYPMGYAGEQATGR